jgi:uncharacterized protein (UPF0548 family)
MRRVGKGKRENGAARTLGADGDRTGREVRAGGPGNVALMVRLVRPSDAQLLRVLSRVDNTSLTYAEVGATSSELLPGAYHHVSDERALGQGDAVFAKAVAALRQWEPQKGSGLSLVADGPVACGTTVAMAAPLPVGFAIATCRVVYVEDDADRFAWAYGTLPVHPERGEERFEITRSGDAVVFRVTAFSQPQQLLARIASPIARVLQSRATKRYLDAMERASI